MRHNIICKLTVVVLAAASFDLLAASTGFAQGAAGAGGAGAGAGSGGIGGAGVGAGGVGGGGVGGGGVGGGSVGGAGVAGLGGAAGGTGGGTVSGAGSLGSALPGGGVTGGSGIHTGTMLPGPRGNSIEQSPGVNGSGAAGSLAPGGAGRRRTGIGGTPRRRGGGGAMGRGVGPVPKGGDPNPAETLLKDMEGTNEGHRTGHAALRPPPGYQRSKHGLSSDPPSLAPERIEEQSVYFAKRGAYEDMVYHPYKGSYRRNEATHSARNRAARRQPGSQTRGG